jgi:MFS family permease
MGRTEKKFYLLQIGFGWGWLIGPIYPLFLMSRGLDLFEMSVVLATYFAVTLLCEVPTGAVADLYGRRFSFILACATRMTAFCLYPFAEGLADCMVYEAIDALGTTLATGSLEAWAIDGMKAEGDSGSRTRVFARSNILVRSVMAVGGIVGAYMADIDIILPWFLAGAGYGATAIYAARAMDETPPPGRLRLRDTGRLLAGTVRGGLREARGEPVVRMMCLLTLVVAAGIMPISLQWPPFLQQYTGEGYWAFGWLSAILSAGAALGSFLTTRILARWSREVVLSAGHLIRGAGILLAAVSDSFAPALAGLILTEFAFGAVHPAFQAWINEHIESERRATVLSVTQMSFTAGGATGLLILGDVARTSGIGFSWIFAGLLVVAAAPFFLRLGPLAATHDREHQTNQQAV